MGMTTTEAKIDTIMATRSTPRGIETTDTRTTGATTTGATTTDATTTDATTIETPTATDTTMTTRTIGAAARTMATATEGTTTRRAATTTTNPHGAARRASALRALRGRAAAMASFIGGILVRRGRIYRTISSTLDLPR